MKYNSIKLLLAIVLILGMPFIKAEAAKGGKPGGGTNTDPKANDAYYEVDINSSVSSKIVATDPDPREKLSFSIAVDPQFGTLELNSRNGAFTYTPNAVGTDTFVVTVTDKQGASDDATITIKVLDTNQNTPPTANDDIASLNEDGTVVVSVLANDNDIDETDALYITSVTNGSNGSVTFTNTTATYIPESNFNGTDSFTYTISDGNGGTDTATVSVEVYPVNDSPVAQNDSVETQQNNEITIYVLTNDSDVDGDTLLIESVTDASNGLVVNNGNSLTYTATSVGKDSFTYKIIDNKGGSDTATVYVTVTEVLTSIDYVALGDSIATGTTTSIGDGNTPYVTHFYNYLVTHYSQTVTFNNLADDGDQSSHLLTRLTAREESDVSNLTDGDYNDTLAGCIELQNAVSEAEIITISIGGNNLMRAAEIPGFEKVDWTDAANGADEFTNDWSLIIAAIKDINPNVKIIVMTIFNPYERDGYIPSGYSEDVGRHNKLEEDLYLTKINNEILNNTSLGYKVADVHQQFLEYANGQMDTYTEFYPWSFLKTFRNPHPSSQGQNVISNLHVETLQLAGW